MKGKPRKAMSAEHVQAEQRKQGKVAVPRLAAGKSEKWSLYLN